MVTICFCFSMILNWRDSNLIGCFFFFFFLDRVNPHPVLLACFMIDTNCSPQCVEGVPVHTTENVGCLPLKTLVEAPMGGHPLLFQWVSKWTVLAKTIDCATEDVPQQDTHTNSHTHTCTHTHTHKTRPSDVNDWTKTGLMVLVCTSLWDLDWFQIATELYHVLKCVFPCK